MLIVCPACVSSYKVEPAMLAREGAALRCAHCRQALQVARPAALPPLGLSAAPPAAVDDGSPLAGFAAILAVLATLSGLLHWREPIARIVPGAGALFHLAGLPVDPAGPVVTDVKTALTADGLSVEGTLVNPGRTRVPVPRLHMTVRDAASETLTSWTAAPPKASLGPGEHIAFTSRLDKPPARGHELAVSFAPERVAVSDGAVKDAR